MTVPSLTHPINRPRYQALMRATQAKSFDVMVAEDMDRVFRDEGDYHHARKRLDHHGITILTAAGKASKLEESLRAFSLLVRSPTSVARHRTGLLQIANIGPHQREIGDPGVERRAQHTAGIYDLELDGRSRRGNAARDR
jgi:hypothetical protein